jgi:CRISPR-associated protein Cas1
MATLYIDRKNTRLKREGLAIAVYQAGERHSTVPVNLLERVVLRGSVELDSGLLGMLAEQGVGVLVLSGRQSRNLASLLGRPHADAQRRICQFALYRSPDWRREWARRLVRHKVMAQLRLLRGAAARRPDLRQPLETALQRLLGAAVRLRNPGGDLSLESIRGIEGAAAAGYFAAYTRLFAGSLGFSGRNRRPPRDPVNAVLSLAYTLLHFDAAQSCHTAGLDPMVGFYHEPAYGRESLAADLLEPLRPKVDLWVWEQFREKQLRSEQFTREGPACYLRKSIRGEFYASWEAFATPLRRLLRRVAQRTAAALVKEADRRGSGEL